MRESNEIKQFILATLGILIANAAIFCIGVYLALQNYGNSFFTIAAFSSAGISITQLLYVIPVIIWLNRRRQFALKQGVIIGAIITALLNGGCYLMISLPR
jgi:hypothetical protein